MANNVGLPEGFSVVSVPNGLPEGFSVVEEPQETLEQRKARIAGYENPHPQHVGWTGQDAIDILGAMAQSPERVLDGATLGYYSKYNREHGGTYEQRKQWLDNLANEAGIGTINDVNNFVLDAGGDISGLGGLLFKGLSKTLKGAKLVSAGSGADATIRGWNEGDDTFNSAVNAGISGTVGAVLGPVFHYGLAGLGKAYNFLRSGGRDAYKKGVDYLRNTFGEEATQAMIKEAEESGRSLAEVVDDSGIQLLQTARQQTPEARNIITKNIEGINENAPNKTRQLVDDTFGGKDRVSTIDELQEQAKKEAAPLWEALNNKGDLALLEKEQLPQVTRYKGGDDIAIAKSIRRNMSKNNPDFKWRTDNNGNYDYQHFTSDSMRSEYLRTLPETYKNPDTVVSGSHKNEPREYLLKKYFNPENGENVYDMNIKRNGVLINKLPREGRRGNHEFNKVLRQAPQASEADLGQSQTRNALSSERQVNNNITRLRDYVKENDLIQREIGKVRKDATLSREVREAADTDFRLLQAVKENIDDQINIAKRQGEDKLVRRLTEQKNELLNRMDEVVPEYKQARQIYEDEKQFERAVNLAQDVFKTTVDAPKFAKKIDELGKREREALKIGLRDEVLKVIGNAENENVSFKKLLPANAQAKIRKVLGVTEGDKLINYARKEVTKMRNFNKLLNGSQTAEKTALQKAADLVRKPVDMVSNLANRDRNLAIARTMTTPDIQAVSNAYSQVAKPRGIESLYQYLTNPDPVRASLAAYFANKI